MKNEFVETVEQLTRRLTEAACSQDWQALESLNQQVDTLLKRLQPVPLEPQSALADLKLAHQSAFAKLSEEKERLGLRIASLQDNQTGLRAYEQTGGPA